MGNTPSGSIDILGFKKWNSLKISMILVLQLFIASGNSKTEHSSVLWENFCFLCIVEK